MSQYLFIAGRIRALEGKMLTKQHLDRMVGANSPADAFRVLTDLQYAEYIDQDIQAQDFQQVLQQGLLEAKELVSDGGENLPELQFLWLKYDLGNIKSALRLKAAGSENLSPFTVANGFTDLGTLSQSDLEAMVFEGIVPKGFDPTIADVVLNGGNELALDNAWAIAMKSILKKHKTSFGKHYVQHSIDGANLRAWARSRFTFQTPYSEELHLPGGSFDYVALNGAHTISELLEVLKDTSYECVLKHLSNDSSASDIVESFEIKTEAVLMDFLREEESSAISTVEIPMRYFEQRAHNARLITLIMFGKFAALSPEHISKRVQLYSL